MLIQSLILSEDPEEYLINLTMHSTSFEEVTSSEDLRILGHVSVGYDDDGDGEFSLEMAWEGRRRSSKKKGRGGKGTNM
ncbi:hypothetical protein L6452_02711 [Arctium lappa]|uniref:Uncharacterized protein n=1 Tax=Arctium lappa TaxID=4217 RepID=A0ACB9FKP5_ARCLA|nr:hypothetical protein L6452_02711 [Arctium lappa]